MMRFKEGQRIWRREDAREGVVIVADETGFSVCMKRADGTDGRLALACDPADFMDATEFVATEGE
ncbi:MAG: hypothetical protein V4689_05895 [Verrucomicrobiota bacterium]